MVEGAVDCRRFRVCYGGYVGTVSNEDSVVGLGSVAEVGSGGSACALDVLIGVRADSESSGARLPLLGREGHEQEGDQEGLDESSHEFCLI